MFSYYGQPLQGLNAYNNENPFITQQPQQQQQASIDPSTLMGAYGQFSGQGAGMFGGGGGAAAGGSTTGAASGASGGSSAGSALSTAGPWAALAAVIIGNEYNAQGQGRRSEDSSEYAKDLVTGKVISQDMPYFSDKVFGKDDKYGFGEGWKAFGDFSTGDFSNGFKSLTKRFQKLF